MIVAHTTVPGTDPYNFVLQLEGVPVAPSSSAVAPVVRRVCVAARAHIIELASPLGGMPAPTSKERTRWILV